MVEKLIQLRIYIESALDFPEEEIDFLADKAIASRLDEIIYMTRQVKQSAKQGRLLKEGMTVVIAGAPNAGKSSLLNQLAGEQSAIVTDIPGTTRDIVRVHIQIDGLPLHIIDTAGLRETDDVVENEGIRRALDAIQQADKIIKLVDINEKDKQVTESLFETLESLPETITVYNKIDTLGIPAKIKEQLTTEIFLSAKTGEGVSLLKQYLVDSMGFETNTQTQFISRRRHLEAIDKTADLLQKAHENLHHLQAGELVAEELRQAQLVLSEITGEFSSDDLLGRIFADFCIGK